MRGARFRLRLPLRLPPPAAAAPSTAAADAAASAVSASHVVVIGGVRGPVSAAAAADGGRGKVLVRRTALVVDDSAGNRRLARRMLQALGCEAMEANDGDGVLPALAAAAAAGTPVDVVLMDIEMPRMDGTAAVAAMRAGGWAATTVIAVTGNSDGAQAAHCALRGGGGGLRGCCSVREIQIQIQIQIQNILVTQVKPATSC